MTEKTAIRPTPAPPRAAPTRRRRCRRKRPSARPLRRAPDPRGIGPLRPHASVEAGRAGGRHATSYDDDPCLVASLLDPGFDEVGADVLALLGMKDTPGLDEA